MTTDFGTYSLTGYQNTLLKWAQSVPVSWLGRRSALALRKLVLIQGHPIIDAVVEGLRLRLYMKDNVSERKFLFMPQFFDPHERNLLRQTLKPGSVFVDVGANAGIYSLTAAPHVGDHGRVLSIEPNPRALDRLRFNARLNGIENRIIVEPSCISDAEGTVDLMLDDTNLGGSSLVEARSSHKISVPAHKLLDVVRGHDLAKIDIMKIDIEGAEDRALIPFLKEAPPALYPRLIILENSPQQWKQDLPAALRAAGYQLRQTTRMNTVWGL